MKDYEVLPPRFCDEAVAMLRERLDGLMKQQGADYAFIGFIDDRGRFDIRDDLFLGDARKRAYLLQWNQGLSGQAVLADRMVIYPDDKELSESIERPMPFVKREIAIPIHYGAGVTGVVVLDSVKESHQFDRGGIQAWRDEVDEILRRIGSLRDHARDQLVAIAQSCLDKTHSSTRGYVAVKCWDGKLDYFPVGEGIDRFLRLSPGEGLCGRVLQTGKPVNAKRVLDEPDYIPSDAGIKAEIVWPIIDKREVVGIINLESRDAHGYDNVDEDILSAAAENASSLARIYRIPPREVDIGYVVGDLLDSMFAIMRRPRKSSSGGIEEEMFEILRLAALRALHGVDAAYWMAQGAPPELFHGIKWQETDAENMRRNVDAGCIVYSPLFLDGERCGVLGVALEGEARDTDARVLSHLCQMGTHMIGYARDQRRLRQYIDLVELLTRKAGDEAVLETVVRNIPQLLVSSHCTLFYRVAAESGPVFVAGPTTADQVYSKQGGCPWYTDQGLTGHVAKTGLPLVINDVEDIGDLRRRGVEWAEHLSEAPESRCRSFMAWPVVLRERSRVVIGVLRTYRDRESNRSRFTEDEEVMMAAIAELVGESLKAFLMRCGELIERAE